MPPFQQQAAFVSSVDTRHRRTGIVSASAVYSLVYVPTMSMCLVNAWHGARRGVCATASGFS